MRLTDILLRWKVRPPRGNIYRGKYRLVKPVTPQILTHLRREFEVQEQNMFYLRNPYFTPEQSKGHALPFKHREKFFEQKRAEKLKWKDNVLLGDRFGFLKVSDKWE